MKLIQLKEKDYLYNIKKSNGEMLHTDIMLLGKLIYLMKRGFSPLIMVVGSQRMGKSFVALWLALQILKFFHAGQKFDVKRNTFYDPIDAVKRLNILKREPLIIDEAGNYLMAKEWYSKINIALEKIIMTQGYLTNCYIMISPFSSDIAKAFRKHFDFLIHVRKRGVAIVKQIPKRYDDLTGKVPVPYTVERIKVSKKAIPQNVWRQYEEYSFMKKEEIRKNVVIQEKFLKKDMFGQVIDNDYEIIEKFKGD